MAPSTWGELDRAPLMVQFLPFASGVSESRSRPGSPALSGPSGERRIFGDGGFAALEASLRRVAGVSRLYWCNSPRLSVPSTWGELDRAPLTAQFLRLLAVRPRFGAAWRPKCRPPRRKRRQWGVMGEVVYVLGTTVPGLVCRSHANPLLRALTGYIARKPAIPRLGRAAHAHISGPTCE